MQMFLAARQRARARARERYFLLHAVVCGDIQDALLTLARRLRHHGPCQASCRHAQVSMMHARRCTQGHVGLCQPASLPCLPASVALPAPHSRAIARARSLTCTTRGKALAQPANTDEPGAQAAGQGAAVYGRGWRKDAPASLEEPNAAHCLHTSTQSSPAPAPSPDKAPGACQMPTP